MKWVVKNCDRAKFVMKVDDDVVVNLFHWVDILQKEYGGVTPKGIILGYVYRNIKVKRVGKWKEDKNTWPYDIYPTYCGGTAYTMSMDVVKSLYMMSHYTRFFWIEDVYFTGLLPSLLGEITLVDHSTHYSIMPKRRPAPRHIFVNVVSQKASERAYMWNKMLIFEANNRNNTRIKQMLKQP